MRTYEEAFEQARAEGMDHGEAERYAREVSDFSTGWDRVDAEAELDEPMSDLEAVLDEDYLNTLRGQVCSFCKERTEAEHSHFGREVPLSTVIDAGEPDDDWTEAYWAFAEDTFDPDFE